MPNPWPSIPQRLVYALVAWVPLAAAIALASSVRIDEVIQGVLIALVLAVFFLIPRAAYVATVATLGLLVVGAMIAAILYLAGMRLPLGEGVAAAIGGSLLLGYVATAGIVILGPSSLRPWVGRQAQTVRNR